MRPKGSAPAGDIGRRGSLFATEEMVMTRDPTEPAEAEQADEMEKVQEDAAEERENEGGYQ